MINNTTLAEFFRAWINDYLTVAKLASDHGIDETHARILIEMGRDYHNRGVNNATD